MGRRILLLDGQFRIFAMLKELRRILGEENVIYIDDRQGGQ